MENWNRQLKRLIWRKLGRDVAPTEEVFPLLQSISDSFDSHDKEYALLNRIMDLSSEELFEANTELRKRNEELDRFVYSTSHDLRAPLTSIMGLLQLIELSASEDDKAKYLELIKLNTTQLDDFIQDIVAYTHNKKVELHSELVDFKEIIDRCIQRLSFMNNYRHIDTSVVVDGGPEFYSDPNRLDNLFSNLISNAIKYFNPEEDTPYIKVVVGVEEDTANIEVQDNGIGIDKQHLDKVFDMFYRASSKSKGSGIGLYIVKEIVEKLSGEVSVVSELNKGTTFRVSIPDNRKIAG